MPDEFSNKLIEEAAKHIPVKEVYDDLASPSAKEIGKSLANVVKAFSWVFAGFDYLASKKERYERFLEKTAARVPTERQVTPAPQMLGPVLEAIRYEVEDTPIDEMFSQLLSSSMDSAKVDRAHPAFIEIIKQLSSDEAIILNDLRDSSCVWNYRQDFDSDTKTFSKPTSLLDERPLAKLQKPQSIDLYVMHLYALGLAAYFDWKQQEPEWDERSDTSALRRQVGLRTFKKLNLTEWGQTFLSACLPDK